MTPKSITLSTISFAICLLGCILSLLSGCEQKMDYNLQVEGLHYIDDSPVRISVKDGKIIEIERIQQLSDTSENRYIAPGLIDNQVNGYVGFSFVNTGGELTLTGVKEL